jgi:hypothetical protein
MDVTYKSVRESLDSAIDNGYELDEWEASDIADDMHKYDATFEDVDSELLKPHIERWLEERKTAKAEGGD